LSLGAFVFQVQLCLLENTLNSNKANNGEESQLETVGYLADIVGASLYCLPITTKNFV